MNLAQHILVAFLRLYRGVVSPAKTALFGPLGRCRYDPTCSAYALDAVRTHGALRGLWLAARRLGRCHPWGGCGHDPVPPPRDAAAAPSDYRSLHTARQGGCGHLAAPLPSEDSA